MYFPDVTSLANLSSINLMIPQLIKGKSYFIVVRHAHWADMGSKHEADTSLSEYGHEQALSTSKFIQEKLLSQLNED